MGESGGRPAGRVYVVMGVSGSGKTAVGEALAARLEAPFYDGDDFHPPANVARMAAGEPLTDGDRWPWLDRLRGVIATTLAGGGTAVVACSALKQSYRERLGGGDDRVIFVFLEGAFDLIWRRMESRAGHYMKAGMLQSQFDTLEPPAPAEALILDIENPVDALVDRILER